MAKLTVEDLKRIKETTKATVNLREGSGRAKITVHMGTCGIAAGARTVMDTLLKKVVESGAKDVILTSSGCAGLCSREPMMTVELKDQAPIKYADLDADKTARIFDEHVMQGKPVTELVLLMGSETTY